MSFKQSTTTLSVGSMISSALSEKIESKRLSAEKRESARIEALSAEAAYDAAALVRLDEERAKEEAALSAALDRIETLVPAVKVVKEKKGKKALAPAPVVEVPAVEVDEVAELTEVVSIARLSVEKAGVAQTAAHLALSALGKRASKALRIAAQSDVDKAEKFNKEQREFLAAAEDELNALLAPPVPAVVEMPAVEGGKARLGSKENPCIVYTVKGVPIAKSEAFALSIKAKDAEKGIEFFISYQERGADVPAALGMKSAAPSPARPAVKVGMQLVKLQIWQGKVTAQSQDFLSRVLSDGKIEGVDFRIEREVIRMAPMPFVPHTPAVGAVKAVSSREALAAAKKAVVTAPVVVDSPTKSIDLAVAQHPLLSEAAARNAAKTALFEKMKAEKSFTSLVEARVRIELERLAREEAKLDAMIASLK